MRFVVVIILLLTLSGCSGDSEKAKAAACVKTSEAADAYSAAVDEWNGNVNQSADVRNALGDLEIALGELRSSLSAPDDRTDMGRFAAAVGALNTAIESNDAAGTDFPVEQIAEYAPQVQTICEDGS